MRKPVGVTVAAVILGVMTAFVLLAVVGEIIGTFFVHNPYMPSGPLGHEVHTFLTVFDLVVVCILVFCMWTIVGLARMRAWARYSIVALGVLTALFFGALSALILHLAKFIRGPMAASGASTFSHPGAVVVAISLFYAVVALIGVWWVVYFNLKHVRQAFAAARAQVSDMLVEEGAAPIQGA